MSFLKAIFLFALLMVFFTGCATKIEQKPHLSKANLQEVSWDEMDGFEKDNLELSFEVFKKACTKSIRYENLKDICEKANQPDVKNSKEFFTQYFTPYKLLDDNNAQEGLITGYYEPILNGSLTKTDVYKYPIYKTPKDILVVDFGNLYPELKEYRLRGKIVGNKVIPYDSREEIEVQNNLEAICYVDDKIDLFFLHIQGSGKVKLQDGNIINVGYAQQNGRGYYPIGRKLIEEGFVAKEDMSLQAIKKWLKENPTQIDTILNLNESYIFFHKSEKTATGSLGVPLVANRNLAVDRSYIPLGFPVFIDTTNPLTQTPIQQLMVAADTGGAIKGEIRADFFFGNGKKAEKLAGIMKQKGSLYILIPNEIKKQNDNDEG
jgi:membrane-bound lytic murein transglycosylase A